MALTINSVLTSKDGGSIDSGAYVRFMTIFPESGTEVHFNLFVYRNVQAAQEGKARIYPIELESKFGIVKQLTEQEYAELTPITIHDMIKEELELIPEIGIGNVSINL